ncbi:hypothetical protein SERLA73DRAFT_107949 [Serpula lacrymans var. lacrymans S7.3]|uniref:Methyltransferase domain-containing protein n=1 Tax=Serpula lacrymans var. lacrymans (strain S7.3) TaxID=936435 RepID=F8PY52_SERL3|nr:hypothetical protein SERLA73DRAFT_107949 [Serpula lacrymans var. lacrymans S7.3]
MRIQHSNPNFPDHLDICPSTNSTISSNFSQSDHSRSVNEQDQDAFGVVAQQRSIQIYGIAGRVWEAAYFMNIYLDHHPSWEFEPSLLDGNCTKHPLTFIELGSGTGIVSAQISRSISLTERDLVIATDLPDVCPLLERNLHDLLKDRTDTFTSSNNVVLVRPLSWGNHEHALSIAHELELTMSNANPRYITHIICSDLVYFPELLGPLLRSLIHLSSPPFISSDYAKVVISYKIRSLSKEADFWSAFGLWFSFEPVGFRPKGSEKQSNHNGWTRFGPSGEQTFVFVAHRRPESFNWDVPDNDQDLIGGIGANGTLTRKGDDTFETFLFMSMIDDETDADIKEA